MGGLPMKPATSTEFGRANTSTAAGPTCWT